MANFTKIAKETLYWLAIILTHPIGATMVDYLTNYRELIWGNITASSVLEIMYVIVLVIGKLSSNKTLKS